MYRAGWCIAALTVTTLLIACQGGGEQPAEQTQAEEQTAVTADEVKQKAQEALTAARQYAQQQKDAYQQEIERRLAELHTEMEALKEQAQQAGEQRREELQEVQQDVEQKLEAARKRLTELQSASVETWEEMKATVDNAIQDVQKSYEEFRSHSSEKEKSA